MKFHTSLFIFAAFSFVFLSSPSEAGAVVQSLNSQTGQNQSFANDSNVQISSGSNVHTLIWNGLLPISRGGTGASTFTAGSIPFISGGVFSQDNSDFFWDNTNKRLGIGTSSPSTALDVDGGATISDDSVINTLSVGLGGGSVSLNTILGVSALANNTVGTFNTAVGYHALYSNTSQSANTAFGFSALENATGGEGHNTAIGTGTLDDASMTGSYSTAVGDAALTSNTSGSNNTAIGRASMSLNTTGGNNTALGNSSLGNNTTGGENTAIGETSFLENTTGSLNTILGYEAARWHADGSTNLTTANNSIYIGALTRGFNNSDSNSIVLGYSAIGAGANTTVIGNSSMTDVYFGSSSAAANTRAKASYLGDSSTPSCLVMGDSDGSGVTYITANDGVLTASSTKPAACP